MSTRHATPCDKVRRLWLREKDVLAALAAVLVAAHRKR